MMTERTMFTTSSDVPTVELINKIQTEVVVDKSKVLSGTAKSSRF